MATVELNFIGLFLFDDRLGNRKRAAVINANRQGVYHPPHPHPLRPHTAFFTPDHDPIAADWPMNENGYELTGGISFSAAGGLDTSSWRLPKIATGCAGFHLDDAFFDAPLPGWTHAVIEILGGTFCTWRFAVPNGAFNTRVTFTTAEAFTIFGSGSRYITFGQTSNVTITFMNTELDVTNDLSDWFWYYNATRNTCAALPDATGIIAPCAPPTPPPDPRPYTLGCSNSAWP